MFILEKPTLCQCEEIVELDSMKKLDGELLCEQCYEDHTRECQGCGDILHGEAFNDANGYWYCDESCILSSLGAFWTSIG